MDKFQDLFERGEYENLVNEYKKINFEGVEFKKRLQVELLIVKSFVNLGKLVNGEGILLNLLKLTNKKDELSGKFIYLTFSFI